MTFFIVVLATKPSKDAKLGIGLTTAGNVAVKITTIAPDGLFAGTDLKAGMILETVNQTKCATTKEAVSLLKEAENRVLIVASTTENVTQEAFYSTTASSSSCAVVVVITKPSKDAKLGIGVDASELGKVKITSIDPAGLSAGTELKVGMKIDAVNGKKYSTYDQGMTLLKEAESPVRIVASNFIEKSKGEIDYVVKREIGQVVVSFAGAGAECMDDCECDCNCVIS